ncbi:MAG: hypothetical protein HYX32_00665 [Actinobacteria bacterium]|nr:hypothetical protein [Actinomycetota bacterium]
MLGKRVRVAVAAAMVIATVGVGLGVGASPASAATSTKTVRYGPFSIPAATATAMGAINNKLNIAVAKPCGGCYITGIQANLTYANGTTANVDTGPALHHMVMSSAFRSDPTCSGNLLGLIGQRFFASGNERTLVTFPPGFGYYTSYFDSWNMIVDLMNMDTVKKDVYIDMKYTYTTSTQTSVKPVWLDVDQCGDSEYTIPTGQSDSHWTWNVNVPGKVVAIGGHVHNDGVRIEATNDSTGKSICNSVATYGASPPYIDMMGMPWISSMSSCIANPVTTVSSGQKVRIHSVYDSPTVQNDVMGIMIAYMA